MLTSSRTWASLLLLAYVGVLAWILFQPAPDTAIDVVALVSDVLRAQGLPEALTYGYRVEFMLNALMFAPVPFLGRWALPSLRWTDWVAYTFIASSAAELIQGLLLPERSAQFIDIVANTLGGVIGALSVALLTGFTIPSKPATGELR